MPEKNAILNGIASRYRTATKKEKCKMLDECLEITGYNRKYAIRLLSKWNKVQLTRIDGKLIRIKVGNKVKKTFPHRKRFYDESFKECLIIIWELFSYMCGKRLVEVLRYSIDHLKNCKELKIDDSNLRKLKTVSAATIDRLLSSERKKYQIKGRSHTKRGHLLKDAIPIKTFSDWKDAPAGNIAADLVGHDGGIASGEFCFTLTITDIETGWTEPRAIKNKARKWTLTALKHIRKEIPLPIIGFNSDNGSEFINNHFYKYCKQENIQFTRSRANKKNDNCYVEQKNFDVVRKLVGYRRYDSDEELNALNQLYSYWRLFVNFFHPSMKLIKKTRVGSRYKKVYDKPKTPYQRILISKNVSAEIKKQLETQYSLLNPLKLKKSIDKYSQKLLNLNVLKKEV